MWHHLNSRRAVKWMIFFVIVQLPIYFVFVPTSRRRRRRIEASENRKSSLNFHTHLQNEQHHEDDDERPAAIRQLQKLRGLAVKYNRFLLFNYAVTFVRAALINLMRVGVLLDYHLVDCFAMGRAILFGKTHQFSAIFVTLFYVMYAVYRNYLGKYRPGFKFNAIEFLLHDYDEIRAHELLEYESPGRGPAAGGVMPDHWWSPEVARYTSEFPAASSSHRRRAISLGKRTQLGRWPANTPLRNYMDDTRLTWYKTHIGAPRQEEEGAQSARDDWLPTKSPLLYIRNTFMNEAMSDFDNAELGQCDPADEYILRLNRTTRCWTILNRFALVASLLTLASLVNILFSSVLIFFGPLTTQFGFEISYSSCVRHLKRIQQAAALAANKTTTSQHMLPYASSIYLAANKSLACDLRLDVLPFFYLPDGDQYKVIDYTSFYHQVRMTLDLYESYLFNMSFVCYLSAISFAIFILALDVVLNAREITKRMVAIVDQLGSWQDSRELTSNHLPISPVHKNHRHRSTAIPTTTRQLRRDILIIQEILVDHFRLVGQYNSYVSFTLILTLMLLFCLSMAFIHLIFTYKSAGMAVEYFVGEIGSIVLVIYLFTGVAITRAINKRIHSLIARAMALDCSQSVTKLRWAIILKYYQPKPLYCFTLLEHTELSWLFCLKFAAWSLSAVFVLAGFLYPR